MSEHLLQRYTGLLYLVRHGEAIPESEDPSRPLSEAGRLQVERLARWAAAAGIGVPEIWHSGKRRAEQTAELIAAQLRPAPKIAAVQGLAPNDPVQAIADRLGQDTPRMLVGHLPSLERLVSALISGRNDLPVVRLDASALAVLARVESGWVLLGLMQPDLLHAS
jgi:phosphohistidine phosphatase